MRAAPLRMLLLGGTAEAMALAQAIQGDKRFAPVYSIAGITRAPRLPSLPCRRGGFGGVSGLSRYLETERIELLVDATHAFSVGISSNAANAARATGTPLLALRRPPWTPEPDDRWHSVASLEEAAAVLGAVPRRVFLTTGKTELEPFIEAGQHYYLVRSIEAPERLPPRSTCLRLRGPFSIEEELALLRQYRIDTLVSKNAGGAATAAKLVAARSLGVEVVMIERPILPEVGAVVTDVRGALHWLAAHYGRSRPTERGV